MLHMGAAKAQTSLHKYGPQHEKTCLRGLRKKGAEQPTHPCSLISALVIHLLENIISTLATGELSIFLLVSVAEETGLSLTLPETRKTAFVALKPIHVCRLA